MGTDLHLIEFSDFKDLQNKNLVIRFSPEIKLEGKLIEVTELGGYSPLERKPFSFVLQTPGSTRYQQSTYIIEHPSKGDLPVFLVPVGTDANGVKYEAVFS